MKHLALVLLSTALLAGCSDSDTPTPTAATTAPIPADSPRYYPRLVLDAEHNKLIEQQTNNVALESDAMRDLSVLTSSNWLRITDTNKLPVYQISPASGVWLDGSHFHFTYGTNPLVPNMVQMILGKSVYKLYWPVETNIYIINSITMEATEGERFRAFHSGDHADVAIGRWIEGYGKTNFLVSWAGQIDVK
jgi:hypothetical protein